MKDGERTVQDILKELILEADKFNIMDMVNSSLPSDKYHSLRVKHNVEQIGKLVQSLPEEDREILKTATSDEIAELEWIINGYTRPRPEKPSKRTRQPAYKFNK